MVSNDLARIIKLDQSKTDYTKFPVHSTDKTRNHLLYTHRQFYTSKYNSGRRQRD